MPDWDMNGDTTRTGYEAEIERLRARIAELEARQVTVTDKMVEAALLSWWPGTWANKDQLADPQRAQRRMRVALTAALAAAGDGWRIEVDKTPVTLADAEVGLFVCQGELCLKTEYRTAQGAIEAYIVSSGEFFWGDNPQTVERQKSQLVYPARPLPPAPKEG